MILKSDHVFLTSGSAIKDMLSPLRTIGINYFSYSRHYINGGRVYLCSSAESIDSYYRNKFYKIGNTESQPRNYIAQTVLWSTLPNQEVFEDTKQMGIDHGLFIIEPKKEYCEFYAFATTVDNSQIVNTYLTNLDFLKQFGEYFKEKAVGLIKSAESSKISLPYHDKKIPQITQQDLFSLFDAKKLHKLSRRQYACAELLIQGKTIKEIARVLSLSPRTIETYINNLKIKLNCDSKASLILKLAKLLEKII